MPYVMKKCTACGRTAKAFHNRQFCEKCGGRLSQSYDEPEQTEIAQSVAPPHEQAGTSLATCVGDVADDLALIARNAEEMKSATGAMAAWFRQKQEIAARDAVELGDAVAVAIKNNWASGPLERQSRIADKRVVFYEKCALACEAGYCIVPNMPASLFAVRTNRQFPRGNAHYPQDLMQRSESPRAGEGEYRDCDPNLTRHEGPGSKPGEIHRFVQASSWPDEIEFPIAISRPQIMTATAEAMALKVFDELAVCVGGDTPMDRSPERGRKRNRDPLVLGIIRNASRTRQSYFDPRVTFLIGWYLDTRAI